MKKIFILIIFINGLYNISLSQVKSINIDVTGSYDVVIEVDNNKYITVSSAGKVIDIVMNGDHWYYNGKLSGIGNINFTYLNDKIISIGKINITYNNSKISSVDKINFGYYNGNISSIGNTNITYYNGKVLSIGNYTFTYINDKISSANRIYHASDGVIFYLKGFF